MQERQFAAGELSMTTQMALAIKFERTTQKQDILEWLRVHGTLTRMQAFDHLGICELSSRIGELERDGYHFHRDRLHGEARNGRKWCITEYSLA